MARRHLARRWAFILGIMMDEAEKKPGMRPRRREGKVSDPEAEAAFDVWLKRSLHQMFDAVAAEPLPPELLRLIENDRARRRG